jgi:transcriptional regulator with PAS, ATPase and Fis domain
MDYLPEIIGQSPEFLQPLKLAKMVAPTDYSVLIFGETGTGKELFAKGIHENSKRKGGPFMIINCGAESDGLLEAELFGHTKGAFTGAFNARVGKFKYAHGGTLFLDEIGDMPLSMQSKVLRAIEQKEFTPLGQNNPVSSDFRIICATNKNLVDCVASGSFREDLYYRINAFEIKLPPLRSRKDDIPCLVEHFTKLACENNQLPLKGFLPEALTVFQQYSWPGNIRQLKNFCESAVILCQTDKIDLSCLPNEIIKFKNKPLTKAIKKPLKEWYEIYSPSLHDLNNIYIEVVFEANEKNKSKTAKALGISRTTLTKRIGELSLV